MRAAVEGVADSGRVETVYNVEVEDDHTYFVGGTEWGFDVWAHNAPAYLYDPVTGKPVVGPRGKQVQNSIKDNHAIPCDNKTFNHQNNPLVKQAGVDLRTYAPNIKPAIGHKGRHSKSLYHTEIQRRPNQGAAKAAGQGQAAAKKVLDEIIEKIWADIGNGRLPLYRHEDVII